MLLQSLDPIKEAAFNSHTNKGDGPCLSGTRHELLTEIAIWAESATSKPIFWLEGMAGTGKSTISRTVAASLKEHGNLAASFFFKRGAGDQGDAKRLFSTIAWQLAIAIPGLASNIKQAIERHPDISVKPIEQKFNQLLLQPICELKKSIPKQTQLVIVIDALDECENDQDIKEILQLLSRAKECGTIRLLFFLTSRPELASFFASRQVPKGDRHDFILHDISEISVT